MRSRLSAAYKGLNTLLMQAGAKDFRSGQIFNDTVFFEESVDIHHVFPKAWFAGKGISSNIYDSIINKTPLSARTNRIIGGIAPSAYLAKIQAGGDDTPAMPASTLNEHLASHLIDPALLRADDFPAFFAAREKALLKLIEQATGRSAYRGDADEPEQEVDPSPDAEQSRMAAE